MTISVLAGMGPGIGLRLEFAGRMIGKPTVFQS